jgi:hypothetical protein
MEILLSSEQRALQELVRSVSRDIIANSLVGRRRRD